MTSEFSRVGFPPVPEGWNSGSWTERASAHYSDTEQEEKASNSHVQEWMLQLMNEPGSHILQYSWACENSTGIHFKEGELLMEVPPVNLIHAREELSIYMNEHQSAFGIDREVNMKPWRQH